MSVDHLLLMQVLLTVQGAVQHRVVHLCRCVLSVHEYNPTNKVIPHNHICFVLHEHAITSVHVCLGRPDMLCQCGVLILWYMGRVC